MCAALPVCRSMEGNKNFPVEKPAAVEEILAHIQGIDLRRLMVFGYVLPALVLWMMVFKPF